MKFSYPSKLKVLVATLIFGSVMVFAQPKRADAVYDGRGWLFALGVMAVATYATVMGVACVPIAAAKSENYPGGFSAARGDCFLLKMKQTAPTEEGNDASDHPAEAAEANRNEDDQ
jgi:hypothetical protein